MAFDVDDPVWDAFSQLHSADAADADAAEGEQGGEEDVKVKVKVKAAADDDTACKHCGHREIRVVEGQMLCDRCHTISGRYLDHGAEWRYYGADDNRGPDLTRCCPPTSELLPSLGSVIGQQRYNPSASSAPAYANAAGGKGGGGDAMRMMQKYQAWNSMTYRERMLCGVFDVLAVNSAQHGIAPCILEEAKVLYKRVADAKIWRGENRSALVACSLYVACKSNRVPRSVKEIAAMFNIRSSTMIKACRMFQEVVHVELDSSAPSDFVGRFCSRLGVCESGVALVRHVVKRADDLALICDSTPPSVAAGAIQMVNVELGLGLDRKAMGEACHISPVTITKCFKRLWANREELLPPRQNLT
jgi:transcription initiation factor TFIIB